MQRLSAILAMLAMLALPLAGARANAISVTQSVSGSPGDWLVSFTVANGLPDGINVYFFGVLAAARDIAASPGSFDPNVHASWSNQPYGGSDTVYNNVWLDSLYSITPGTELGGFAVHSSTPEAPAPMPWFAYGASPSYLVTAGPETGCFQCGYNPGYESVAVPEAAAVPEPASAALATLGLFALAATRRRR